MFQSGRCQHCSEPLWAAPTRAQSRPGPSPRPSQSVSPGHTETQPGHYTCPTLTGLEPHLEELEHAEGAVWRPIVRPRGELEVADVSLLPRYGVGDLQVRHDEVLVVLDIFRLNAVNPTVYTSA